MTLLQPFNASRIILELAISTSTPAVSPNPGASHNNIEPD